MEIINTSNLNEAYKQIQRLKKENKEIIVHAQDDKLNRKMFERDDVDVILGLELHDRRDRLKQRDSGLNEIHCKLAKKNNIKIGIDLDKIRRLRGKKKAIVLARIIQNIKLCKRVKIPIVIFPRGKYKKQDVLSFFLTLKSSTQQGKQTV